jgi:hypothetical protein
MENVIEGGVNPEYPTRGAMIRVGGSDATGYVECWDKNGTTLKHSDNAAEALITISSTARSVAQFIYTNGNGTGLNTTTPYPGLPAGTVGWCFRLVSGAVAINNAGDTTGGSSGGTGIDSASAAPTANSPRQASVAGTLIYSGQYRGQ